MPREAPVMTANGLAWLIISFFLELLFQYTSYFPHTETQKLA
jgi:hypothetical protein